METRDYIVTGLAIILAFWIGFMCGDDHYNTSYVAADDGRPKVILPANIDTLDYPDILRVDLVKRNGLGEIDTIYLKHYGNPIINIPHPTLTFVAVNIRDMTIYTRENKTLQFGYDNLWDITSELGYLFPHRTEFHHKLEE